MSFSASRPSSDATPDPHSDRLTQLRKLRDRLRPGQKALADWRGGELAVSAVPGSGKSTGMAIATAILLGGRQLQRVKTDHFDRPPGILGQSVGQFVLVTFTRSAAANLKAKIRQYLAELALPPSGFVVYTLHGLALSIASRHPDRSGLDLSQMTLISPNQRHRILRTSIEQWIADHPQPYQQLLEGRAFDGEETERLRRQSVLRTEVLPDLAHTIIHEAKSSGLLPEAVNDLAQQARQVEAGEIDYGILAIAAGLYEQYQKTMRSRQFIDYEDMILGALQVLEDPTARHLWRSQITAVFEDEAQDSSPLQTKLLEVLAASPDDDRPLNLVRVGDPNQAINSTFTPADPSFFREFCQRCQRQGRLSVMDQAGRSSGIIMAAANTVLTWVNKRYGTRHPSDRPFQPQAIRPVDPGDPQPAANPAPIGRGLELCQPDTPTHTADRIAQRVAEVVKSNPQATMAILVRENRQGSLLAKLLSQPQDYSLSVDLSDLGITLYDVGERARQSHVPQEVLTLLHFIDRPHSPDRLKAALKILTERERIPRQDLDAIASFPEQFLYPGPLDPPQTDPVRQARRYCAGLLRARLELPQHQLIPFLAFTLQYNQAELATADKLAERIAQQTFGNLSLAAILDSLSDIVSSERFEPVETSDTDSRYARPKQLTIITMHKAKGLDWDVVFLPFLHADLIPGQLRTLPQAQFLGDMNLSEVARAQLRAHIHREASIPTVQDAWQRAIALKTAEEYRLFYVAMTRAKRLLWMAAEQQGPFSWSNPDNIERKLTCPGFTALQQAFPEAMVEL
jgi:DNA helicase-2/ATP-dependent DNA helicase PcrA